MKKASHLFLTVCLTILVYVLYVPIIALFVASWPFRIMGWLLKSAAMTGSRLQGKMQYWSRLQTAYAYGCLTVADYEWKVSAEKRARAVAAQTAAQAAATATPPMADAPVFSAP